MVIAFANQKGGVGKTTLAIAYANHLAYSGRRVLLIDTDFQRSCSVRRTDEMANWDKEAVLYNIESHLLKSEEDSINFMKKLHLFSKKEDVVILIDVPGNITEPYLAPIFIHSDYIVCPFVYQMLALDSTSTFVKVILRLKKLVPEMHAKLIFVPNMVEKKFGTVDELENFKLNADAVLEKLGILTPRVYNRAELKRISTILYTPKQRAELNPCFSTVDSNIFSLK